MNVVKTALLGFCAVGIVACSSDDTPINPPPTTKEHTFTPKQGDYATYTAYSLDENDQTMATTATYSSRTVLQVGMTYAGQTGVTMAVDSTFKSGSTTEAERVDTSYFRTDDGSLYIYNFAQTFASLIPTTSTIQIEPIPSWTRVADLKNNASNFTETLKVRIKGTTFEVPITITCNNKGKQTVQAGSQSYTAFVQELTAKGAIKSPPIIDIDMTVPISIAMGGVKDAANSPNALLVMTIGKFPDPIDPKVSINGRTQILTSFKAGN